MGSLGVAAAAALRYEGWILAVVWIVIIATSLLPAPYPRSLRDVGRAWWEGRAALAVAVASLLVPAAWMALHLVRHGNPVEFSMATAGTFARAYGGDLFAVLGSRLAYYPAGLARSAPILCPVLIVLAIIGARHVPRSRLLIGLITLHFTLFYVTSIVSQSVGAFTERFMFAFVLALTPLLGMIPSLVTRLPWRPASVVIPGALIGLVLAETVYGLTHRPDEWAHAPDLLQVTTVLGDIARTRGTPLRVVVGDGLETDLMPLHVQNGKRLSLRRAPNTTTDAVPADVDIWVERLPARLLRCPYDLLPSSAAIISTDRCRYPRFSRRVAPRRRERRGDVHAALRARRPRVHRGRSAPRRGGARRTVDPSWRPTSARVARGALDVWSWLPSRKNVRRGPGRRRFRLPDRYR